MSLSLKKDVYEVINIAEQIKPQTTTKFAELKKKLKRDFFHYENETLVLKECFEELLTILDERCRND